MIHSERLNVAPAPRPGNAGIRHRYPIDAVAWIWHPDCASTERAFLEFQLETEHADAETVELDITADNRFILCCDDQEIGRGPDRAEVGGWSFHRYRVTIPAGKHQWRVTAWWLPRDECPQAQASARPGLALMGLDAPGERLSTGSAPWQVRKRAGFGLLPKPKNMGYHVIGSGFDIDGSIAPSAWVHPAVVAKAQNERHGTYTTPWRLEPSCLPEQARSLVSGGRIRALQFDADNAIREESAAAEWQAMTRGGNVVVPAHTTLQLLWDFEDYVCGYPRFQLRGGAGSEVTIEWAEALYNEPEPSVHTPKGHRGECAGKHWLGFGDRVRHPGGERTYEGLWWRSGRWLRILVRTGDEALELRDLRPLRTGHPFSRRWEFSCDLDLQPMLDLCERGLRNCVHETFVDCPYFEQMMYTGDTRIQALAWLVATGDTRPVLRALQLFDRSRWVNGFHAERCPTWDVQMSATYSLVLPPMLRDFAWWCDEPAAVRSLLPGMRSALDQALACLDEQGLPAFLPGWLFVDWVNDSWWTRGCPNGADPYAVTAPVCLHLPIALDAAAQLEDAHGDPLMAERWRNEAGKSLAAILQAFPQLSDDLDAQHFGEHTPALLLDCRNVPPAMRDLARQRLLHPRATDATASVYFSHHVHEALLKAGHVDAVLERFGFWRKLMEQGFLTTVEAPEPARSDCHGWGAHPIYHCLSAIAGIRPDAPGFARVRITPRFGPLQKLHAVLPHPQGEIRIDLQCEGKEIRGNIHSPVAGVLCWEGREIPVNAGENTLS